MHKLRLKLRWKIGAERSENNRWSSEFRGNFGGDEKYFSFGSKKFVNKAEKLSFFYMFGHNEISRGSRDIFDIYFAMEREWAESKNVLVRRLHTFMCNSTLPTLSNFSLVLSFFRAIFMLISCFMWIDEVVHISPFTLLKNFLADILTFQIQIQRKKNIFHFPITHPHRHSSVVRKYAVKWMKSRFLCSSLGKNLIKKIGFVVSYCCWPTPTLSLVSPLKPLRNFCMFCATSMRII